PVPYLVPRKEDLRRVLDGSREETRGAHATGAHPAAEGKIDTAPEALVQERPSAVAGENETSTLVRELHPMPVRRRPFPRLRFRLPCRPRIPEDVLDTIGLDLQPVAADELPTAETVCLHHGPEPRARSEQGVHLREHLFFGHPES